MIVRSLVTFRSDLADDGVETEDRKDFIEWPGRVHALVLSEILQALDWRISRMVDANEHGWELEAGLGRKWIWAQVTPLDEVILMFKDMSPERTWYFAKKPPGSVFTGMLTALDAALQVDSRFHDVRWFTSKEYDFSAPGAPKPVSDILEMAGYVPPPPPPQRPWREWDHPWRDR